MHLDGTRAFHFFCFVFVRLGKFLTSAKLGVSSDMTMRLLFRIFYMKAEKRSRALKLSRQKLTIFPSTMVCDSDVEKFLFFVGFVGHSMDWQETSRTTTEKNAKSYIIMALAGLNVNTSARKSNYIWIDSSRSRESDRQK
jgi:hypothetical protein